MLKLIQRFITSFNEKNFRILGFELLLFSMVFGIAYGSWLIFGLMLVGLSWLMSRPKGTFYLIFVLSFLWGFIAFSIGYSLGWGWGAVAGLAVFLFGVNAHMSGLKRPFEKSTSPEYKNLDHWRKNWHLSRQSLN